MIRIPESQINNLFYAFKMDPREDKKVDPGEPGYDAALDFLPPHADGIAAEELITYLEKNLYKMQRNTSGVPIRENDRVTVVAAIWVLAQILANNEQVNPISEFFGRMVVDDFVKREDELLSPSVTLAAIDIFIEAESKISKKTAGDLKKLRKAFEETRNLWSKIKKEARILRAQAIQRIEQFRRSIVTPPPPPPPPPPKVAVDRSTVQQILIDGVLRQQLGLTKEDVKSEEGWKKLAEGLYHDATLGHELRYQLNDGARTPADAYRDDFYLPGETVRVWGTVRKK